MNNIPSYFVRRGMTGRLEVAVSRDHKGHLSDEGDVQLGEAAVRLEIEAWGRDIKGGNLFHLRIRLSWPGLDTADCQGLISGAGTKAAVQSASNIINNRRSVAAFLASFIPFSKFIQSAIFIHFNFEAAYKYKLSASSRDINNADSASEENVNKVET